MQQNNHSFVVGAFIGVRKGSDMHIFIKDPEERALYLKHRKLYLTEFLHDTIPFMAAAAIAKAGEQFLYSCIGSGDISDLIAVYFVYSLCAAHVIGYLVALFLDKKHPLFEYYFGLATDNAGFSWNTTLTLVIINWLYNEKSFGVAIVAWLFLVVLVVLVIYGSNYVQDQVIEPSKDTKYVLRNFESEAFALAISYSFTVVIAASIYKNDSTEYLSNTDDVNSADDHAPESRPKDYLFLLYCVGISVALSVLSFRADKLLDDRLSRYRQRSIERARPPLLPLPPPQQQTLDITGDYVSMNALHAPVGLNATTLTIQPPKFTGDSDSMKSPREYDGASWQGRLIDFFLSWDDDKSTLESLSCLFDTTAGYLVGSAWNVWAVLSFYGYFKFKHGDIIASFIFAAVMTVVVLIIMTRISVHEIVTVRETISQLPPGGLDTPLGSSNSATTDVEANEDEVERKKLKKGVTGRGNLLFIFGRLSVGWAWQQFISNCTTSVIASDEVARKWLLVLVDVLTAVFICYTGGIVLLYFEKNVLAAVQEEVQEAIEGESGLTSSSSAALSDSTNRTPFDVSSSLPSQMASLKTPLL